MTDNELKVGLAEMLQGGIVVAVDSTQEAKLAEQGGAVAVMATVRDVQEVQAIQKSVSVPVIARCRLGHFAEAQILETLFVDFLDESDESHAFIDHENQIDKHAFKIPFICVCDDFGQALRRIVEGASAIRTNREGSVAQTAKTLRNIKRELRRLESMDTAEINEEANRQGAPVELLKNIAKTGELPVPIFAAGDNITVADVSFVRQLGAESVIIGRSIFSAKDPLRAIASLVEASEHYQDPEALAKIALGEKDVKNQPVEDLILDQYS